MPQLHEEASRTQSANTVACCVVAIRLLQLLQYHMLKQYTSRWHWIKPTDSCCCPAHHTQDVCTRVYCSAVVSNVILNCMHQAKLHAANYCAHCWLQGPQTVRKYVQECRDLHFDAVELPDACADMLPEDDYLRLLDDLQEVASLGSTNLY